MSRFTPDIWAPSWWCAKSVAISPSLPDCPGILPNKEPDAKAFSSASRVVRLRSASTSQLSFWATLTVTDDIRAWHLVDDSTGHRRAIPPNCRCRRRPKACTAMPPSLSVASIISSTITWTRACLILWRRAIRASHWLLATLKATTWRFFPTPPNVCPTARGRSTRRLTRQQRHTITKAVCRRHHRLPPRSSSDKRTVPDGHPARCSFASSSSSSAAVSVCRGDCRRYHPASVYMFIQKQEIQMCNCL